MICKSDATTPEQRVDLGVMAMKGYSTFPESPGITEASLSNCFISRTLVCVAGGGLTPLQRCSQCILQPQPIELFKFKELKLHSFCLTIMFLSDMFYDCVKVNFV